MKVSRQQKFRLIAAEATPAVAAYLARRQYPLTKADIDDLVEDVLVVAWRRIDDIPVDGVIPWMIGIARNVRRNAVRKHHNGDRATAQLRAVTTTASAEDSFIGDETIRSALAALSDDDRDILLLHYWDGQSTRAIATMLGVSENAAAVRLSRSQDRFRNFLEKTRVS